MPSFLMVDAGVSAAARVPDRKTACLDLAGPWGLGGALQPRLQPEGPSKLQEPLQLGGGKKGQVCGALVDGGGLDDAKDDCPTASVWGTMKPTGRRE